MPWGRWALYEGAIWVHLTWILGSPELRGALASQIRSRLGMARCAISSLVCFKVYFCPAILFTNVCHLLCATPLPLICTHGALSCLTAGTFKSFCCRADEREQWNKPLLPSGGSGKETACQYRRCKRRRFDFWVEKSLCSGARQSTPVFLSAESHEQSSLAGYRP